MTQALGRSRARIFDFIHQTYWVLSVRLTVKYSRHGFIGKLKAWLHFIGCCRHSQFIRDVAGKATEETVKDDTSAARSTRMSILLPRRTLVLFKGLDALGVAQGIMEARSAIDSVSNKIQSYNFLYTLF